MFEVYRVLLDCLVTTTLRLLVAISNQESVVAYVADCSLELHHDNQNEEKRVKRACQAAEVAKQVK